MEISDNSYYPLRIECKETNPLIEKLLCVICKQYPVIQITCKCQKIHCPECFNNNLCECNNQKIEMPHHIKQLKNSLSIKCKCEKSIVVNQLIKHYTSSCNYYKCCNLKNCNYVDNYSSLKKHFRNHIRELIEDVEDNLSKENREEVAMQFRKHINRNIKYKNLLIKKDQIIDMLEQKLNHSSSNNIQNNLVDINLHLNKIQEYGEEANILNKHENFVKEKLINTVQSLSSSKNFDSFKECLIYLKMQKDAICDLLLNTPYHSLLKYKMKFFHCLMLILEIKFSNQIDQKEAIKIIFENYISTLNVKILLDKGLIINKSSEFLNNILIHYCKYDIDNFQFDRNKDIIIYEIEKHNYPLLESQLIGLFNENKITLRSQKYLNECFRIFANEEKNNLLNGLQFSLFKNRPKELLNLPLSDDLLIHYYNNHLLENLNVVIIVKILKKKNIYKNVKNKVILVNTLRSHVHDIINNRNYNLDAKSK